MNANEQNYWNEVKTEPKAAVSAKPVAALPAQLPAISHKELMKVGSLPYPELSRKADACMALMRQQPGAFITNLCPTTVAQAAESQTPTIRQTEQLIGKANCQGFIVLILQDFAEFYSSDRTLSDKQLIRLCQLLSDDYGYLRFDDIKLALRLAQKGAYGNTFARIDGEWVMHVINAYVEERSAYFVNKNETARLSFKEPHAPRSSQAGETQYSRIRAEVFAQQILKTK